ncbi:MAG: phosphate/phosphite/phosphonate ABC transporter substrate-binding protein [Rhodobacteraceae bacterium]|nr:phosphate/phosphite/phosphonate ABC transporter substrate-binding protein [Paracoccaceae bacterium]
MYNPSTLDGANDRFWHAIRTALGYGPQTLSRNGDLHEIWQSPDLLFAQTCSLPYRALLHPDITLVGTPDYGLPGCPPGYYNSRIIVRIDAPGAQLADFSGARFAYNGALSQSGWAGPMHHFAQAGITFSDHIETGGHNASANAVAEGRADIAGIDALTLMLMGESDPDLVAQLQVIDCTAPTPALPFITASGRDPAPIADAVRTAISTLSGADRQALHLHGLVNIPAADYLAIPTPPGP